MNRGVYLKIDNDERMLGTVRELLDPVLNISQKVAARDLWEAATMVIAEMVFFSEDETTATLTIEIK